MHAILALPTLHNVHTPLKRQFGDDIVVSVLSEDSTVALDRKSVEYAARVIRQGVSDFFTKNGDVTEVDLILTGFPLAVQIAYMMFKKWRVKVNFLVYNSRTRKYVRITENELELALGGERWTKV